jgi:lysozyme family protein
MKHEGGFTRNPKDRGNWTSGTIGVGELRGTNRGISAMRYPTEDIANLTRTRARALYHADFWNAVRGDELPPALAPMVFDFAVNSGPARAVPMLQQVLLVQADGVIGPRTLAAAATHPLRAATKLARSRLLFLAALDKWPTFGSAWTTRTLETLVLCARIDAGVL